MQDIAHFSFLSKISSPSLPQSPTTKAPSVDAKALPLDWLLGPKSDTPTERVLARLVCAEAHEPDVWERENYRQSFITVALAAKGSAIPFVEASYRMYGLHPDKVWPAIVARRERMLGNDIPHKTMNYAFSPGTGRLVDEEPNADGTSSLPAYESQHSEYPNEGLARISSNRSSEAEVRESSMSGMVTGPGAERRESAEAEGQPATIRKPNQSAALAERQERA